MWNMTSKLKQSIRDKFSAFHHDPPEKLNLENKNEESKEATNLNNNQMIE